MRRTLSWAAGSLLTIGLLAGPIAVASTDTASAATASAATAAAGLGNTVSPASPISCYYTVLERYPSADPAVVEEACVVGGSGGEHARHACYSLLRRDYVPAVIAMEACRKAAE